MYIYLMIHIMNLHYNMYKNSEAQFLSKKVFSQSGNSTQKILPNFDLMVFVHFKIEPFVLMLVWNFICMNIPVFSFYMDSYFPQQIQANVVEWKEINCC